MSFILIVIIALLALPAVGALIVGIILIAVFSKGKSEITGGLTGEDLRYAVQKAREAEINPEPRTVFGATSIYLPRITADFPDYHNEEAITAVKKLIFEYLAIRYEGQESFSDSNTDPGLERMVDRSPGHTITDEKVHAAAISDYRKTNEYATVTYQASVGYRLDAKPVEERYAVKYTLKLTENDVAAKLLVCPRCGGTFGSTAEKECPFCGSPVIRDTVLSWRFTSIEPS